MLAKAILAEAKTVINIIEKYFDYTPCTRDRLNSAVSKVSFFSALSRERCFTVGFRVFQLWSKTFRNYFVNFFCQSIAVTTFFLCAVQS